ncbi:hypothetical protein EDB85DRAFT_1904413 [Lactarius pseudohatsudake]|nr:hypothetical protein EDB85DRAFT_1904413 [Lactarius pseudohatsudake]
MSTHRPSVSPPESIPRGTAKCLITPVSQYSDSQLNLTCQPIDPLSLLQSPSLGVLQNVRHPSISFSDPEDNISSGRESFDEDDMYGSDTGDDFICDSMESDGGSQEPARGIAHGLCIHLENIYTLTRALCEAWEIEGVSALPLGPTLIDDLTLRTSSELIGSNIADIEEEAENDEFGVAYW